MRITKYKTMLNEDREISLVKEDSVNYSNVTCLRGALDVFEMMNTVFKASYMAEEYVWIIALDSKSKTKGVFEISHGGLDYSLVSPREIFIRLCLCGASCFIMVHNHPSGDVTPSDDDKKVTDKIKEAGDIMNIKLLDHIIIGNNTFLSMHNVGIL